MANEMAYSLTLIIFDYVIVKQNKPHTVSTIFLVFPSATIIYGVAS